MDIDRVNNYRMIQAGAAHVVPIIAKRRDGVISAMISKYKNGERDFVGEAAELCVLHDILNQLKQNESNLNNTEQRIANGK